MNKLAMGAVLAVLIALPTTVATRERLRSPSPAGSARSESAGRVLRSRLGGSFESRISRALGDGAGHVEGEAGSVTELEDSRFGLLPSCPNPFNPTTTIFYRVPEATNVDLALYDVSGRLVRSFTGLRAEAGVTHRVVWDGTRSDGRPLPSGIYLLMLRTETSTQVDKLVLLK